MDSFSLNHLNLYSLGAIVITLGIGYSFVELLAKTWRKNKEHERLAVLKQQMLDRGMSAEEIVRVIEAGKGNS